MQRIDSVRLFFSTATKIIACAWLFSIAPLWSQSTVKIEGWVWDAESGRPLSGANIQISGTTLGAAADGLGYFSFSDLLVGEYALVATFIGYGPQRIGHVQVQLDQPVRVDFNLKPQILQMPLIAVTANRATIERPPDQVLTGEKIRTSNAQSLGELLQNVSGLTVERTGVAGADAVLSIRGSKSNQVLVLLDGMRLSDPLTGDADLSAVPLSSIERIEVYKGGQSDQYGNGAMAGVIHIVTRKATENRLEGKLQAGVSANERASLSLLRCYGDWNLLFSGEVGKNDGDYRYTYAHAGIEQTAMRVNADSRDRSIYGKIGWDPDFAAIQLSWQEMHSERGLPGQVFALTPYARAHLDRRLVRLQMRKMVAQGHVTASIAWNRQNSAYDNRYDRFAVAQEYRSVPPYWNENSLDQRSAELTGYHRSHRIGVRAGAVADLQEYRDVDHFVYGQAPVGKANLRAGGVWIGGEYLLLDHRFGIDRCEVSAALRQDWVQTDRLAIERQDRQSSPNLRLVVQKNLLLDWQVVVQNGRSFRLPGFTDLFFEQFRVKGNPELLPEKMNNRQIDLTAAWHRFFPGRIRIALFNNHIEDLIIWRMGNFAVFSPVNTDARLQGQEIDLTLADRGDRQSLSISYLHLNSENRSERRTVFGKQLPYRAEHSAKLSVRMHLGSLECLYDWRWVGDRFVTEANTIRMDAYHLHDLTLAMPLNSLHPRLQTNLRLTVTNLLDTPIQMFENAPLPGRQWRLGVDFVKQ